MRFFKGSTGNFSGAVSGWCCKFGLFFQGLSACCCLSPSSSTRVWGVAWGRRSGWGLSTSCLSSSPSSSAGLPHKFPICHSSLSWSPVSMPKLSSLLTGMCEGLPLSTHLTTVAKEPVLVECDGKSGCTSLSSGNEAKHHEPTHFEEQAEYITVTTRSLYRV